MSEAKTSEDWINQHQDEVSEHFGNIIAVHPTLGIVAVSKSIKGIMDILDHDIRDEVLLVDLTFFVRMVGML